MSRPIIEVRGVSKRYQLGVIGATSLKDELARQWERLRNGGGGTPVREPEEFWALRDVSFSVQPGEVVGIIGSNGAGKSTLLKILSRITQQTAGEITLRGRVASLLEVGTGFHPDLTGRENVFLNGAIMGMTKSQIRSRFDEIVAFAEIDQFIDTPVKRYSSGMYVRLAFAVAAHLEPEILIVDEVLAVGDVAFQQKCLGRMSQVAGVGRTVLFVSHNMSAVQSLCGRSVLLDHGTVSAEGATWDVVNQYLRTAVAVESVPLAERSDRAGDGSVRLTSLSIESTDESGIIRPESGLRLTIGYTASKVLRTPTFLIGVYDYSNAGIYALRSDADAGIPQELPAQGTVSVVTDRINLTAGRCYVNVALLCGGVMADHLEHAAGFEVSAAQTPITGRTPTRDWAMCTIQQQWFHSPDLAS